MTTAKHHILIIGGGTAGISVAARLQRKGHRDVAVIEPSSAHYYQPLWTLVGGGQAKASTTQRSEASVMPKGATWIKNAATAVDPANHTVTCSDGAAYEYDVLVVCPGIQLDWNRTEGLQDALGKDGVSSNYRFDLAPRTWDFIRNTRSGSAVFTMPSGPLKCAGAPQKIAYLASDYWRKQGVRPEPHAVVAGDRPDQAAPGVLVPQEIRPAVYVLEFDAQGPRLAIRLRHNGRTRQPDDDPAASRTNSASYTARSAISPSV